MKKVTILAGLLFAASVAQAAQVDRNASVIPSSADGTSLRYAPTSQSFDSVVVCQAWINHPTPTGTDYFLSIEAYAHSNIPGVGPQSSFSDANGLVAHVHQTTNNVFRRSAESASVQSAYDASTGLVDLTIKTQSFRACTNCYTLTVTNGPTAGGRVLKGTLQFAGDSKTHALDCGILY